MNARDLALWLPVTLRLHRLADVARRLAEPGAVLSESARRRARRLAWLLLTLGVLVGGALCLILIEIGTDNPRRGEYGLLITGLLVLLVLAYRLNHAGHYTAAAGLTVGAATLGPWVASVFESTVLQADFVPLIFGVVSVLVCSILLPERVTVLLAIGQVTALLMLSWWSPHTIPLDWPSLLTLVAFMSALSIVVNRVGRNDLDQIDRQAQQLTEDQVRLQSILDNSPTLIYLKDTQGHYLLINRQYEEVFHVARSYIIGKTAAQLFPPELAALYWASDQKVLQMGAPLELEEAVASADGVHIYTASKFPLFNSAGRPYAVCSLATDITKRKRAEEALRQQSVRDPLTGLFNRRYLEETLERELRRAARHAHPVGILMLDLDHFKALNDMAGHAAGDAVLCTIGELLRAQIRASDIACRYGGDEFTLILPEAPLLVTRARAEQLRVEVQQLHLGAGSPLRAAITLSVGVAAFPDHGSASETVLKAADMALYRAKGAGRDCVVVAETLEPPVVS